MIKEAIEYLQESLMQTHLFTRVYGLCELLNKDGKTYPAYYKGGGEYQDVSQFDREDGVAYFRLARPINISKSEGDFKTTSCADERNMELSLKLVCLVKKEKTECDDAYAASTLAMIILKQVESSSGLGSEIQAISAKATVSNIETDGNKILKDEYLKPSINEMNLAFAYITMEVNISILFDKYCIDAICYN